jgi:CTD small phosphatase-like protein 2
MNILLCITGKKTLVFDLDETLIHCNESVNMPSDVVLPIRFPTGEVIEVNCGLKFIKLK